jgi:hypothetical protein
MKGFRHIHPYAHSNSAANHRLTAITKEKMLADILQANNEGQWAIFKSIVLKNG